MRCLAICGSLNPGSRTMMAIRIAAQGATEAGAEVELVDLREFDLPMLYAPGATERNEADAKRLKDLFHTADALIVASPEYHGSFSGALKNAFDLMGFDEFEGKMVALIGVAGGALGATNALNHLRVVCRQLHAWVLPDQVSVAGAGQAFDDEGRAIDERIQARLNELGIQLVKFATLHGEASANKFVQLWEQSVRNPGGD